MGDVTFGVKVSEELKKQLEDLQKDSGLRTGKDFMQQLLNSYVLEKTKESIPAVAEDLKELQTLTQRINNIYLNLGYRIENINQAQEKEKQELLQSKDSIITDLQARIEILRAENDTLNNNYSEAVNIKIELDQRVNELTESNNNIKALIEEYKGKNDMLLSQLKQFEKYPEQLENAKGLLADSQSRNVELTNTIKNKDFAIEKLNSEVETVKQDKEKIVRELNTKHSTELEAVKEKAELLKDKAILELQKQQQQELQELQHKHTTEIEQYQAKYKQLLEQLEKVKTSTPKNNTAAVKTSHKPKV